MEADGSQMTERILNLTLEIIYLLTGENYIAFKLADGLVAPNLRNQLDQSSNAEPPPTTLRPQRKKKKTIEDVTSEMIELLTGEVPVRCQDVTVYFTMEEWEYLEEHKDLYKDVMMVDQSPLPSPDGSSSRNPPEIWTGSLYAQDCTQEDDTEQAEHLIHVKEEAMEQKEEVDVKTLVKWEEEEVPTAGSSNRDSPDPLYFQDFAQKHHGLPQDYEHENLFTLVVKEEAEETHTEGDKLYKEEEIYPQYCKDGEHTSNTEETPVPPPDGKIHNYDLTICFPEENTITIDHHTGPHCADLSYDHGSRGEISLDESCSINNAIARTNGETFPCPMCGGCFSQRAGININTGDTLYSCSECGKCFTPKQRLMEHMRASTGPKPYSCSQCGKSFPSNAHLVIHYRLHTGEKPYSCSDCGKCFHQKSNLNHHQVIHLGEKPFSCLECGKRFLRKADLVTHQKTHTGLKPYSCPHCGKCYSSKSTVIKHQRIHMG